jgi:hypothetical protein
MKSEKFVLLETIVTVLYVAAVFDSSFYLLDSLMGTYQQMAPVDLESLLAL